MSHDEKLVEQVKGNQSFATPIRRSEKKDAIPYMWKAHVQPISSEEDCVFYPLEFLDYSSAGVSESVVQNTDFMMDISQALLNMGLSDLFGVSLLHRSYVTLAENEAVLETSNDKHRRLNFAAISRNNLLEMQDTTQTLWSFKLASDGSCGGHSCSGHTDCSGHCIHCSNHCGNHCGDHSDYDGES